MKSYGANLFSIVFQDFYVDLQELFKKSLILTGLSIFLTVSNFLVFLRDYSTFEKRFWYLSSKINFSNEI